MVCHHQPYISSIALNLYSVLKWSKFNWSPCLTRSLKPHNYVKWQGYDDNKYVQISAKKKVATLRGLTLPVAERSSDSCPPNQANFWPSYEDILGPFAGWVKQAIAKERHSRVRISWTPWNELKVPATNRIKRFLQASFVGGSWVEGTGWRTRNRSCSPLFFLFFFFSRQGFYCSHLMTVFRAPNALFRQHFVGPGPFRRGFSFFFLSFGIINIDSDISLLRCFFFCFFWHDYQKKCFCTGGFFFCEGTILLVKY